MLFRFTWINDLNGEGKLLITCFCLASVNCGPRTAVAGVNAVGQYCSVRVLFLGGLSTGSPSSVDQENNHTVSKNKQSKYGKLYFIEHSSEYLST